MKKQISILCILLLLGMVTNAQVNIPQVIPSLQNWKTGKGKLALPATGKIIVAPEAESLLKETAEIVTKDLKAMFGWNYQVNFRQTGKKLHLPVSEKLPHPLKRRRL